MRIEHLNQDAPGRDKDGFPIKEVEEIKRLGAQRVDSPHGVFYRMPMRALYPEKVRKMSVDFRGKLWYVVLLTKGG